MVASSNLSREVFLPSSFALRICQEAVWVWKFLFSFAFGLAMQHVDLPPQPGMEPVPSTTAAQSPNHWTDGEVPRFLFQMV